MRARLLLAAIVVPAFTLTAQERGTGATTAARVGRERLGHVRARSASVDHRSFATTTAKRSGVRILERSRSAVFLGVGDTEPGTTDDGSLLARGFSPYPMPGGLARALYADPGERFYISGQASEKRETPPAWRPTVTSGSGCWWLWVFIGVPVCR